MKARALGQGYPARRREKGGRAKKYTYAVVEDEKGRVKWEGKILYEPELWQPFSTKLAPQEVQ